MLPLNWVSSSMRDALDDYQQTRSCQNLIAQVMLQAIVDHLSNVRRFGAEAAMGSEPARWIMSDEERPFGYLWCCDALDLAPDRLRAVMDDPSLIRVARDRMKKARRTLSDGAC